MAEPFRAIAGQFSTTTILLLIYFGHEYDEKNYKLLSHVIYYSSIFYKDENEKGKRNKMIFYILWPTHATKTNESGSRRRKTQEHKKKMSIIILYYLRNLYFAWFQRRRVLLYVCMCISIFPAYILVC